MPDRTFPAVGTVSRAAQTTTNAYVDLGETWWTANFRSTNLIIVNSHATNGAHVKVLGSVDNGTNWDVEVQAEVVVGPTTVKQVKCTDPYTHLKVQVKSQVADTPATVLCRGFGTSA